MNRAEFLDWPGHHDARYEFDGFTPVAMTGGTLRHNTIALNLYGALRDRLRGRECRAFALDAGVATLGDAVRYPDTVVTCTRGADTAKLVPDPVVVFEVLSPSTGRIDRIVKVREYGAVPSIRRYVILEHASADLTVLARERAGDPWTATTLTAADLLPLPELGIEIAVEELYAGLETTGAE